MAASAAGRASVGDGRVMTPREQSPRPALGQTMLFVAAGAGLGAFLARRRAAASLAELRRLAEVDDLTGLLNRRCFMSALEHSFARARETGGSLSLALLDVDHFKQVNDQHGHSAGDAVLRIVAQIFSAQAREGDILGRIGGEEFALLLPGTTGAQARLVCERLRKAVAAQSIVLPPGTTHSVTVSAGVAELGGKATPDSLMTLADAALYEAKRAGRNMVRLTT